MSDALCGPANPLQQFKQQSQLDRTLQQDRLTSRHSPAQGFRSANPNAGLLDPEFEAFQAGVPAPDLHQFQPFHQPRPSSLAGPAQQAPSWATDFQRMQISSPPPFQQQHVPQTGPSTANWAQGFQHHISQAAPPRTQNAAQSPQAFQHMARYGGMNAYQSNYAQPQYAPAVQSKGKEAVTEHFDDAAFEQAFDMVREALTAETAVMNEMDTDASLAYEYGASTGNYEDSGRQLMGERNVLLEQESELHHMEHFSPQDVLQRLESDPLAEEMLRGDQDSAMHEEAEEQKPHNDDDALALTAQELLEKVEHNQTDKFRNSQFLSLMRKLRDREVKVEGDQMVETTVRATPAKHPTLDSAYASGAATPTEPYLNTYYYNTAFRRSPAPEFDSHIEYGWSEEHEFDHWESPADTETSKLFDNSEQTPRPAVVDGTPLDYGRIIPPHEQDHDHGRINPQDGQEVVDLLNQPVGSGAHPDDIGTSVDTLPASHPSNQFPPGVFYGDLRDPQRLATGTNNEDGLRGSVRQQPVDWKRWDLHTPGYRSPRGAQPAPGLH
ncbi:hypothetical protein LTR37_011247 [Vermiconidia calcicola]|uniref:Uncharacterized protein n=1 Tax=Vermiconidia calcicola TaxID=1690605 RepID=A0ACC3N5N0_9PEZI|nr:hypothetical protein LTR37_011247 [Vermiconidia calcicola]